MLAVHLQLIQHCVSTILTFKKKKDLKKGGLEIIKEQFEDKEIEGQKG